jgi:hypothetical protein
MTWLSEKASLAGLLGGMSLEECAQKGSRQLGIHILVVAYRNTTRYSIEAPWNLRCVVRWASQRNRTW